MFKKLRIKFIAITMVMIAIVMALSFTVVCIVEYQRSSLVVQTALESSVDQAVQSSKRMKFRTGDQFGKKFDVESGLSADAAASQGQGTTSETAGATAPEGEGLPEGDPVKQENAGVPPDDRYAADGVFGEQPPAASEGAQTAMEESAQQQGDAVAGGSDTATENATDDTSESAGTVTPPSIGNRAGQQRGTSEIVPVAVYRVDENGSLVVVPEITSASISSDVLDEAASAIAEAQNGFGTLDSLALHYSKTVVDSQTFVAFADTSYTDSWKTLAVILLVAGISTLVVFFIIILFYSRWALKPVREAWDSQRQFVADASHDLKTPLTVILANAAILLKHPDHTIAGESQWVESTQKEAEQMQGLVNEMLELAQVEAGQQSEQIREPIDLSDLVDGETLLFDSVALERNCTFNCSIEEDVTVLGDEKHVKKMVSTLVENAFKYVDEKGVIDITLRKVGKNAVVSIRNSGSTISEQDLPHIFDRFYRTDKARTSGAGGFGLGLAIAREVALQHGGDITCASNAEEGTTFTIKLPAQ